MARRTPRTKTNRPNSRPAVVVRRIVGDVDEHGDRIAAFDVRIGRRFYPDAAIVYIDSGIPDFYLDLALLLRLERGHLLQKVTAALVAAAA
jgi:hypothetical protein